MAFFTFFTNIHLIFFQLCFAYKGMLKDEVGMRFTYQDSKGTTLTLTTKINTIFNKGSKSVLSPKSAFDLSKMCKDTNYISVQRVNKIFSSQMELQMHESAKFSADTVHWEQIQSAGVLPVQGYFWWRFLHRCRSYWKDGHCNRWKWYRVG